MSILFHSTKTLCLFNEDKILDHFGKGIILNFSNHSLFVSNISYKSPTQSRINFKNLISVR